MFLKKRLYLSQGLLVLGLALQQSWQVVDSAFWVPQTPCPLRVGVSFRESSYGVSPTPLPPRSMHWALFFSGFVGLGCNMSTEKTVAGEMEENTDALFNVNFWHWLILDSLWTWQADGIWESPTQFRGRCVCNELSLVLCSLPLCPLLRLRFRAGSESS